MGESSKYAAEMLKEDVNFRGGLQVGNKKYMLEFIYEDNEAKAESAVITALKLIEMDREGITILLVEQNANLALHIASRGYVLDTGAIAAHGTSEELLGNPEVKKAYLGAT